LPYLIQINLEGFPGGPSDHRAAAILIAEYPESPDDLSAAATGGLGFGLPVWAGNIGWHRFLSDLSDELDVAVVVALEIPVEDSAAVRASPSDLWHG
jgi:hypothetical protein